MKLYSKIALAFSLAVLLPAVGCKKMLDVNTSPNQVNEVTADLLLPSIQVTIANTLGVNFNVPGSIWNQYWTQNPNSSQYKSLERYQPTAPDFDRPWLNLYTIAGADLVELERVADKNSQKQYKAIAMLLRAYMFQLATDAWGDIPYSEALRGTPADGGIVNPKYDAQKDIYNGLINSVDEALALIDLDDENAPGTDDLIYGGDMELWEKFGNTLKLRMLLRLAYVDPGKAQAGIAALNSAAFIDYDEDAQISYSSTPGNSNPLYAEIIGLNNTQNLVASSTIIDSMKDNADPRIGVFYNKNSGGAYSGIKQGDFSGVSPGSYSIPSANVGGNPTPAAANAPVLLLSSYESKFLQAEAAARGWLSGDAQSLFEEGIDANFYYWGLPDTATAEYIANAYWGAYPAGGALNEQIRFIITQKWFSMAGNQGFESWTEWRRTGYPDFFKTSEASIIGPGNFPQRFLYPDIEITRNFNFPGTKAITDKVWWDVN